VSNKKKIFTGICVSLLFFGFFIFLKNISKKISGNPNTKVTVILDWSPNTNHTGIYVAKEKGYFAKEHLDVQILQQADDATEAVATGKIDFAISSQESVTEARVKDIPIVSVAAIIQHNTSAFASLASTHIITVRDFEGKRYGGWGSPIEEAVLTAVMQDARAQYSNVKNITIGTTDFFNSIGRDADFEWIFYGWDGIEAKRRGIAINTIMLKDLNPILDYYTPVIITNEQHVKEQKELVTKFMNAVSEGYTFSIHNPDEAGRILLRDAPELNADLVHQSQAWLSPRYQADTDHCGEQKAQVWQRYAQWMFDKKLIEKMITVNDAFTNEFLPK